MYVRSLVSKIRWVLSYVKSGHRTEGELQTIACKQPEFSYVKNRGEPPIPCTEAAVGRALLFCRRVRLLNGEHRLTKEAREVAAYTKKSKEDQFLESLGEFMKGHIVDSTGKATGYIRLRLAIKEIWKEKGASLPRPREIRAKLEEGTGRAFDEDTLAKSLNVLSTCRVLLKYRRPIYLIPDTRETQHIVGLDQQTNE